MNVISAVRARHKLPRLLSRIQPWSDYCGSPGAFNRHAWRTGVGAVPLPGFSVLVADRRIVSRLNRAIAGRVCRPRMVGSRPAGCLVHLDRDLRLF